jgi:hypothetical protein
MTTSKEMARSKLIHLLQCAHAGELAAYYAYQGHALSLKDQKEREEVSRIQYEEWEHRQCLAKFLLELNAKPQPIREFIFMLIGKTISFLCRIGGWFIPMYGAGKLESGNIEEYVVAAKWAHYSDHPHFIEPLLEMAEVEWDHELYFRQKSESHWMYPFFPKWHIPDERSSIRLRFQSQLEQ